MLLTFSKITMFAPDASTTRKISRKNSRVLCVCRSVFKAREKLWHIPRLAFFFYAKTNYN